MLFQVLFLTSVVAAVSSSFQEDFGIFSAKHSSRNNAAELFRVKLVPGSDLVLRERSNPCSELTQYCKELKTVPTSECIQANLFRLQNAILPFFELMKLLDVDATFFMSCSDELPYFDRSQHSEFYAEMLHLLGSSSPGDAKTLKSFDLRRNEMRLNASEEIDLYRRALVLHPNSTYVISQFGLILRNHGYEHLAKSAWQNAVNRGLFPSLMQRPEWYYVPRNDSKPWYDPNDFPFAAKLREGYHEIRNEVLANLKQRRFVSKEELDNRLAVQDNQWKLLHLKRPFTDNYTSESLMFPKTMKIIENCGQDFLLIKFSAIVPGTHIKAHTGPSNDRLRVHLCIFHTGGARLRVGDEWRSWEEGEVVIFDSSWEHEVYHNGPDNRLVLILDIPYGVTRTSYKI